MEGIVRLLCAFLFLLIVTVAVDLDCDLSKNSDYRRVYFRKTRERNLNRVPKAFAPPPSTPRPRPPWASEYNAEDRTQNERKIINRGLIKNYMPTYEDFINYLRRHYKNKGKWVFNIYNERQINETITMFEMFKYISRNTDFVYTEYWAFDKVNIAMYDYAMRLVLLYKPTDKFYLEPPYVNKPNYFINGETIVKAYSVTSNDYSYDVKEDLFNQVFRIDDKVIINTNYSGWQIENERFFGFNYNHGIKFFTEDIELNSYYYGLHLMYPYWLTNEELEEIDDRFAEHYYFVHKQLLARYYLEAEQFAQRSIKFEDGASKNFNPHLIHDNGLPFPTRYVNEPRLWDWDKIKLKEMLLHVQYNIRQGVVILDGRPIMLTEENHMVLLPRYLRDAVDGPTTAPLVRAVMCNCSHLDNYTPTTFLHPSTSLRDPYYWRLIKNVLDLITMYQEEYLSPLDLSKYETEDYRIINFTHPKLETAFEYYRVLLVKPNHYVYSTSKFKKPKVYARQRRRISKGVQFNITVQSKRKGLAIVRIFLGPPCSNESCWDVRDNFFRLDAFKFNMTEGINNITWFPHRNTYSSDVYYNYENDRQIGSRKDYCMYLFPKRLILPRGLIVGMDIKIFIMITPADNYGHARKVGDNDYIVYVDRKPLDFPFHRKARKFNINAANYKFFNATIFHTKSKEEELRGSFTYNLY